MPRYIVFLGDVKVIDNIEKEGDIVNAFQKEKTHELHLIIPINVFYL